MHISGISQANLRQMSCISQAYLRHISGISQTHLRHISGNAQGLQYIFSALSHSFSIAFLLLSQSLLKSLKTYCNLLHNFFQISIPIASQSGNFMLVKKKNQMLLGDILPRQMSPVQF